ncbi:MAG: hypothetical protein J7L39_02850 [Candidatus Aenigmarchaeota archaeon]|nr:hypothetical protein [Candidatus Aenigmarchaeota archaeon]
MEKTFEITDFNGRKAAKFFISLDIYPLEVIYSAGYILMDKAYILLDKEGENKIKVLLIPKKENENLESLVLRFNEELLNYSVYVVQAARNSSLRKAIVERALGFYEGYVTQEKPSEKETPSEEERPESICEDSEEYEKDPLGIMEPWTPEKAEGLKTPEEIEREILGLEDEKN